MTSTETTPETFQPTAEQEVWLAVVQEWVSRIQYRGDDYRFRVEIDSTDPAGRVFVQLQHLRPDAYTGEMKWGGGGKSYLSPHMTLSEVVRRCLGVALAYEEHEVREFFRYRPRGESKPALPVFGPHIHVDALYEVAHDLDVRP